MLIRKIIENDKPEIFDILKKEIGLEYLEEMLIEWDNALKGNYVNAYVALEDKNIIGYITLEKKVKTYYIGTVVVSPNLQNNGIGTELINYIKQECGKKNEGNVILNVVTDADAQRTITFYLKCGFEISGHVKDEYIPGTNQVHLSLKIM
ncbi:MAG TPA: GNAT family N-acetyltransferase [Candidatus Nanoarchaeia archaeon]|nr:GNAT family N-acetyltransferase [Candidatus Woesearchaeota archaeon]HLC55950.1 GNAT family N-acetyltransferase [Candidatus Nanoarchaeia archaeon]